MMRIFSLTPRLRRLAVMVSAGLLSACSLAPVYDRPAAPIPVHYPVESSAPALSPDPASSPADAARPLALDALVADPVLRELIDRALRHNRNLRQALLNVEAARAQYGIRRADQFPWAVAQADGSRRRTPAGLLQADTATTLSSYTVGVGIPAFELDLFGRVRSLAQSAIEEFLAAEHNARAARLSVVTEVMQTYLLRLGAQRRHALTLSTLQARESSLRLVVARRNAGAATALDVEDAQGLTLQARADLEQVDRELQQSGNALRLLVGDVEVALVPPSAAMADVARAAGDARSVAVSADRGDDVARAVLTVQDIGAGTPSDLLHNRPDVLAAERLLRARNADIGAARAAFFPRISLTAFFGSASTQLGELFQGNQRSWSFAPQLTLPIFDAGRNRANLDLAQVRKDVAIAQYEGVIQIAFREVADALAANDTLRREAGHRQGLLQTSRNTLRLADARYRSGLDSNLRYLDAQRTAYANEIAYINVSTQQQVAIVNLFRALGGDWHLN